jgi:hypothetical protein
MDQDLDLAWRRSGSSKDRVDFSAPYHPFEVRPPFRERLNKHQPRVWESLVQLGRPSGTHSNVEYDRGCKSKGAVMSKHRWEGVPPAARPVNLESARSERGQRARSKAGSQGREHRRHSTPRPIGRAAFNRRR